MDPAKGSSYFYPTKRGCLKLPYLPNRLVFSFPDGSGDSFAKSGGLVRGCKGKSSKKSQVMNYLMQFHADWFIKQSYSSQSSLRSTLCFHNNLHRSFSGRTTCVSIFFFRGDAAGWCLKQGMIEPKNESPWKSSRDFRFLLPYRGKPILWFASGWCDLFRSTSAGLKQGTRRGNGKRFQQFNRIDSIFTVELCDLK